MVCLTHPVGLIGALARMPWVAVTETDIKNVYPRGYLDRGIIWIRGICHLLVYGKKGWDCPQSPWVQNWKCKDCLSIFLPQVLASLIQLRILCHFRWPLEWRWPLVAPELQDSPWGRLSNAKGERALSLWLGRERLGSLWKRKAPLWASAHSWTNC